MRYVSVFGLCLLQHPSLCCFKRTGNARPCITFGAKFSQMNFTGKDLAIFFIIRYNK